MRNSPYTPPVQRSTPSSPILLGQPLVFLRPPLPWGLILASARGFPPLAVLDLSKQPNEGGRATIGRRRLGSALPHATSPLAGDHGPELVKFANIWEKTASSHRSSRFTAKNRMHCPDHSRSAVAFTIIQMLRYRFTIPAASLVINIKRAHPRSPRRDHAAKHAGAEDTCLMAFPPSYAIKLSDEWGRGAVPSRDDRSVGIGMYRYSFCVDSTAAGGAGGLCSAAHELLENTMRRDLARRGSSAGALVFVIKMVLVTAWGDDARST